MKLRTFLLIILLLPVLLFGKEGNIFDYKAPFKTATIYMKLTGTTNGQQVTYIKDWGQTKAIYTEKETKIFGIKNKEKTIEIITPEWIYHYNLLKNEATKSHNPVFFMKDEYNKLSAADKKKFNENAEKLGKTSLAAFNGKFEENAEKILGYSCDKTEMMGATVYNIHNTDITLKSSTNMMGLKMNTEAVKIEKGKADEKKFQLPQGITPEYNEEADKMAEQVARNEVHSIVEGKVETQTPTSNGENKSNNIDNEEFKKSMKKLKSLFGN